MSVLIFNEACESIDLINFQFCDGAIRPRAAEHLELTRYTHFYAPTEAFKQEFWLLAAIILRLAVLIKLWGIGSSNFEVVLNQASIMQGTTLQFRLSNVILAVPEYKVKYLIVCRWVCYCLSLLNKENILDVNNRVYNITQKSVDWCGLLFIRMTLLRINIQDHNG